MKTCKMVNNYFLQIKRYFTITLFITTNFINFPLVVAGNDQGAKYFNTFNSDLNQTEINRDTRHGIVGAFVFPHGGITVDPENRDYSKGSASTKNTEEESIKLNRAMKKAAYELIRRKPDLIILATPHGFKLQNHFLLVGGAHAEGSIGKGKYTASFDLDLQSSSVIYKKLLNLSNPVEMMTLGSGRDTLPIRWAEVIPWIFLKEAADNERFKLPPVVLIGVPRGDTLSPFLKLGNDISNIIDNNLILSKKRIAIVISCDLSHYHSTALSSPYPFNEAAQPFDNYCVEWAKLDRNRETEEKSTNILIHHAGDIMRSAGSCGYRGLVILHGILSQSVKNGDKYQAHFYEYSVPSYFGMMVNSWLPLDNFTIYH